jgi:shikimate kinase
MDLGRADCGCNEYPWRSEAGKNWVGQPVTSDIADPEVDVENRINAQIRQTIADVLSEIVQEVFTQSFSDVIQLS